MPDLVGNPEDRFSHDATQMPSYEPHIAAYVKSKATQKQSVISHEVVQDICFLLLNKYNNQISCILVCYSMTKSSGLRTYIVYSYTACLNQIWYRLSDELADIIPGNDYLCG